MAQAPQQSQAALIPPGQGHSMTIMAFENTEDKVLREKMSGLLSLGLIDTTLSRTLVFRSVHDSHVLEYMLNSIFGLCPLLVDPYGYRDCVIWCVYRRL